MTYRILLSYVCGRCFLTVNTLLSYSSSLKWCFVNTSGSLPHDEAVAVVTVYCHISRPLISHINSPNCLSCMALNYSMVISTIITQYSFVNQQFTFYRDYLKQLLVSSKWSFCFKRIKQYDVLPINTGSVGRRRSFVVHHKVSGSYQPKGDR